MTIDFDDFLFGADLGLEPTGDQLPPLGLIVAAPAAPKTADGFDELAEECKIYLQQVKQRGMFTPIFAEQDTDTGEEIESTYRGDDDKRR
jgi:hypothetical protein